MTKDKTLKKRGIIGVYKMMLKNNTVQQNGPAYHRMRELEKEYIKETRWLRSRLKDDDEITFGWQTKNHN
jgi:hypothetical protein